MSELTLHLFRLLAAAPTPRGSFLVLGAIIVLVAVLLFRAMLLPLQEPVLWALLALSLFMAARSCFQAPSTQSDSWSG